MEDLELESPKSGAKKTKCWVGTADEAAGRLGLSRRSFYRWIEFGEAHNDPFPVNDSTLVVAWYDRMKAIGVFKHACPKSVIDICSGDEPELASPGRVASASRQTPIDDDESDALMTELMSRAPSNFGIVAEREALEKRVAVLREASEEAARRGNEKLARSLRDQYNTALEQLRRLMKDAPDPEEEKRQWEEWFAEDLNSIIPSMISTWMNDGPKAQRELESTLSRPEFIKRWKSIIGGVCRTLARSRFAPALQLSASDE